MEICSYGHDEIAYNGRKCPMCEMIHNITLHLSELESEIDDIKVDDADTEKALDIIVRIKGEL